MIEVNRGDSTTVLGPYEVSIAISMIRLELNCGATIVAVPIGPGKRRLSLTNGGFDSKKFRWHYTGPPEEMEKIMIAVIDICLRRNFGNRAIKPVKQFIAAHLLD